MSFCYDDYLERKRSHEEGLASEHQSELEKLEFTMLETLMGGGSLWVDVNGKAYEYDASGILADRPGKPIVEALSEWCGMNSESHLEYTRRVSAEISAEQRYEDAA